MRNYFIFNGIKSSDYGAYIDNKSKDDAPERDIESVEVPGRNGTLTIDKGRYQNITVPYTVFIRENFARESERLRSALLKEPGYHRLEDTIHPDEFRKGKLQGSITASTSEHRKRGYFELNFDCMPQRFLKRGEKPIVFTSSGMLYNPTDFDSHPLIRLFGTGTLTINSGQITIYTTNEYTDIDCEIFEAYKGEVNCNANVSMDDDIVLNPGKNTILMSDFSKVVITPRWWIL